MDGIKIGITGFARSGKDTVAGYLCEHYNFHRYAFADEMKRIYHEIFGDNDFKQREGYQFFGEAMRTREEKVWIRKMYEKMWRDYYDRRLCGDDGKQVGDYNVVVTDLRLPVEYEELRQNDFIIIRVNAQTGVRIGRMLEEGDSFKPDDLKHETERYVHTFDVDYEIWNDGGFKSLWEQVDVIMRDIQAKRRTQ